MDFLDVPAAIQLITLITSCGTQDVGPNKLINPEILMTNHFKSVCSFTMILRAFVPDTDIPACVCIVLLLKHVPRANLDFQRTRQHSRLACEGLKFVIIHSDVLCFFIDVHLHLAEVFSCVFWIK